jgi:hypothetical protein
MIEQETMEKKEVQRKIIDIERLQKDYVNAFNVNMKKKYAHVDHIKGSIEKQKVIDEIIRGTDGMIQSKLVMEKRQTMNKQEIDFAKKETSRQKTNKERRKKNLLEQLGNAKSFPLTKNRLL